MAVLLAALWAVPAVAEDNDYPHNEVQNASCNTGTCHTNYGGGAGPDVSLGDIACLFCHDDTDPAGSLPAPTVVSHSSATTSAKYGTWSMTCIDCHNNHLQMQYWTYGPESYVASGVSDVGGVTEYTLTMTGAGWEPNSFAGMVLFPNVEDLYADWSNYGIVGNTSDTITVKGPMLINGGPYDTPIGTGGKQFAVILGKVINSTITTPNSGQREVRFFRREGANSYADGDATYDGICEVCHTKTTHHRNDGSAPYQSHNDGTRCISCHPHSSGFKAVAMDHTAAGVVLPDAACMECHQSSDPDLVAGVHGNQCGLCHTDPGGGGPLIEPLETSLPHGGTCTDCHGSLIPYHGAVNHNAEPGSGSVVLFPDNGHDDAGWTGSKPYFAVTVDCTICHNINLPQIHGNACSTCHPTPVDTVVADGGWNLGCQQGGCHVSFHADSKTAHAAFEDPGAPYAQCILCHDGTSWDVPQANCLNCHAAYATDYLSTPVTTSNALASYIGTAKIVFSMTENGKVAIGRTFYKLDGGAETGGAGVSVSAAGTHTLEFWSVDQAGHAEATHNTVNFAVTADTTPPVTSSNAQASYSQGALITLSATDNSTLGVKATYYSLNGGPTQAGTAVTIPATSGTVAYTLEFWSEDWDGNSETHNSASFTVTSGNVTLHLVWADCDNVPANAPAAGDSAHWTIYKGGWNGPVVASGGAASPNWSGINDVVVPYSTTRYYVRVDWYWAEESWSDQTDFPAVNVSTPGQTIRLSY